MLRMNLYRREIRWFRWARLRMFAMFKVCRFSEFANNLRRNGIRAHPSRERNLGLPSFHRREQSGHASIQGLNHFGLNLVGSLLIFSLIAPAQVSSGARPAAKPQAASAAKSSPAEIAPDVPGLLNPAIPTELPQDQGIAGWRLALLRLATTARLMQAGAPPDGDAGR